MHSAAEMGTSSGKAAADASEVHVENSASQAEVSGPEGQERRSLTFTKMYLRIFAGPQMYRGHYSM